MKCPYCGGNTSTIDGRQRKQYYIRRKQCNICGKRFSTHEIYVEDYTKPKAFIKSRRGKNGNDN